MPLGPAVPPPGTKATTKQPLRSGGGTSAPPRSKSLGGAVPPPGSRKTTPKKKTAKKKGRFDGNFLSDLGYLAEVSTRPQRALAKGMATLPIYAAQGVGTMMGAAAYDLAHPSAGQHATRDMVGQGLTFMGGYYGGRKYDKKTGTFSGKRDIGLGTFKNVWDDPTQLVLDAATLASAGGASAAKLGQVGALGQKGRALSTPGRLTYNIGNGEAVTRVSSRNPWTRKMQEYRHATFNKLMEDLPVVGDKWSEGARGLKLEQRRAGRRVNVQTEKILRPFDDATRGLTAAEKVAVSFRHQAGKTADGPLVSPSSYRAELVKWIEEDGVRLAEATTSHEQRYWSKILKSHQKMDRWLEKADGIYGTVDTNPKLQAALQKMRDLNEVSEDVILAQGLIDPAVLAERPYLMTRVLSGSKALRNEDVLTAKLAENPGYQAFSKALEDTMPPDIARAFMAGYVQSIRNVFGAHNMPELEQLLQVDNAFKNLEVEVRQGQHLNPVDFEDALLQQQREPYPYADRDKPINPHAAEAQSDVAINPNAMKARQGDYVRGDAFTSKIMDWAATLPDKVGVQELESKVKGAGIKDEEMKYSGFNDFIKQAKAAGTKSVTRTEVMDFINEHHIRVDENYRSLRESGNENYGDGYYNSATKYGDSSYVVKGGNEPEQNYREISINLPEEEYGRAYNNSSHWPEPNNIAHLRMTDRFIDGLDSTFLEEAQSDIHQGAERAARTARQAGRDLPNRGYRRDLSEDPDYLAAEKNARDARVKLDEQQEEVRSFSRKLHLEINDTDTSYIELVSARLDFAQKARSQGQVLALYDKGKADRIASHESNREYYTTQYPGRYPDYEKPYVHDVRYSEWKVASYNRDGSLADEMGYANSYYEHAVADLREFQKLYDIAPEEAQMLFTKLSNLTATFSEVRSATRSVEDMKGNNSGQPDLPFKENWPELLVKRALYEAASDDKQAFAWTVGDIQARRNQHGKYASEMTVRHLGDEDDAATKAQREADKEEEWQERANDYAQERVNNMDDDEIVRAYYDESLDYVRDNPGEYFHPHDPEPDMYDFEVEKTDFEIEDPETGEYILDEEAYDAAVARAEQEYELSVEAWADSNPYGEQLDEYIRTARENQVEREAENELEWLRENDDEDGDRGYNGDGGYEITWTDLYGKTETEHVAPGIYDDYGSPDESHLERVLGEKNAAYIREQIDAGETEISLNDREHSPLVYAYNAKKAIGSGHFYDSKLTGFVKKYGKQFGLEVKLGSFKRPPDGFDTPKTELRVTRAPRTESNPEGGFRIITPEGETKLFEHIEDAINYQADTFGDVPRLRWVEGKYDRFYDGYADRTEIGAYAEWYDFPEGFKWEPRRHERNWNQPQRLAGATDNPRSVSWGQDVEGPFFDIEIAQQAIIDRVYQAQRASREANVYPGEGTLAWYVELTPEAKQKIIEGRQTLWQRVGTDGEGGIRGAYEYFGGGKGKITVAAGSVDADTWVHEGAHHLRRMIEGSPFEDRFATAAGAVREGDKWVWNRAAEEKFADMVEAFMREQRGPVGKWYREHAWGGGMYTGDGRGRLSDLPAGVRLGFKALITNRAKLEGKSWWGGSDLGSLRLALADSPPGFFPHVASTLREKRGLTTVRRGARPLAPPDFVKFNTGWRIRYSRWLPDPSVLKDHHLKLMSYVRAKEMQQLALRVAEPVDSDLTLKDGYHYIIEENKDRPTKADIEAGLMDGELQDMAADDVQNFVERNITSQDHDRAKQWESEGHTIKQISDTQYKILFGEFKAAGEFVRRFYDNPTNVWRTLTLNYRPAWVVNNFVGQTLLYFVHHGGRGAFKSYLQAFKEEKPLSTKASPSTMPDELRFSGMFRNESPITHAQLAPIRAMEHKIRNRITEFNARLSDNVPRNAAFRQNLRSFEKAGGELGELAKLVRNGKLDINDPKVRELHDAIIENVLDTLIDFSSLSDFERRYMRRVFPFYSWIKGIMKSTAILGFHHPGRLLVLYMLSKQGERTTKEMYGDASSVLAGFVPYPGQEGKNIQTGLGTAGLNPFATVGQTAGMPRAFFSGGNQKDNPFLQMNPIIQGGIEMATRQDLFTKRSLGDSQFEAGLRSFGFSVPEVQLIKDLIDPSTGPKKMTPQRRRDLLLRFAGLPQTQKNISAARSIAAKIKTEK